MRFPVFFQRLLRSGLANFIISIGVMIPLAQAEKVSTQKNSDRDVIPQVLTYAEVMKLSIAHRQLYLQTLIGALEEVEELKQKNKSKSQKGSAHLKSDFPDKIVERGLFLMNLLNLAWAQENCAAPYELQEVIGQQGKRCVRKVSFSVGQPGTCDPGEVSLDQVCNSVTCIIYCSRSSSSSDGSTRGIAPRDVDLEGCRRAGGNLVSGRCNCPSEYKYRESSGGSGNCYRPRDQYGCQPTESSSGDVCELKPRQQDPPQEQCLPRSCTVNREVQNESSREFRRRPESGANRQCINAGMVTEYDHRNPHCPRIGSATLGGFTTEPCPARQTICNPLIFGLRVDFKPICVPVGWATTRKCADESRRSGARDLFTNRPDGLTEQQLVREWDNFRRDFQNLCVDDSLSANFHCVECGVIARRNGEFLELLRRGGTATIPRTSLCYPYTSPQGPSAAPAIQTGGRR